jgi:L-fuconolactonase
VGGDEYVAEAALLDRLGATDERLRGVVAHLPLERGAEVGEDLAALRQTSLLRGIRRVMTTEINQALSLRPSFLAGTRLVGEAGLPVDICVNHWGLVFAIALAQRVPECEFVLDHLGRPGVRDGLFESWARQLRELAELPNVSCKISGLVGQADRKRWTRDELVPYVSHAIECFGFDRVMFGSDWPLSELTHAYGRWVEIVDFVVEGVSDSERRRLYRDNAIRVYDLER